MLDGIRDLRSEDAGELLTLQRAAFVTLAQAYDDAHIPALTQSFDDLRSDLETTGGLALRQQGRLIASVRLRAEGDVLHISRLVVAPDRQREGIGRLLVHTAEGANEAARAQVRIGHRSSQLLRAVHRRGYQEVERRTMRPGIELVILDKVLQR